MPPFARTGPRGRQVILCCYRRGANLLSCPFLRVNALRVRGPSWVYVASRSDPLELDGFIRLMTLLCLTSKDRPLNIACLPLVGDRVGMM